MIQFLRQFQLFLAAVVLALLSQNSTAVPPQIPTFTADQDRLPVGGRPWLQWEAINADRISISPGIGDVGAFTDSRGAGDGVVPAPVSRLNFVSLNSTWVFLDDGEDLTGQSWQALDFDDDFWFEGDGPLGYGDPVTTAVEFGGDEADKFITYYFRHAFDATQANIDGTDVLYLELQRDDGAIVYLNGTEVLRDSLPEGEVTGATLANRVAAGNSETQVFRAFIDKSLLKAGQNILAAEVHQSSSTSSDMIFDAALYGNRTTSPVELLGFNEKWRFLDDGSELADTGWEQEAFSDAEWKTGHGEFGYDSTEESTLLDFGADPNNKHITYYFRRKFLVGDAGNVADLFANVLYDDGAILYINGDEVARLNLPSGAVSSETLAIVASPEGVFEYVDLSEFTNLLFSGENTMAVELHQWTPDSSDVSFDMDLTSISANRDELVLIENRALWKYDDTGGDRGASDQEPDTAWFGPNFGDAGWASGLAELGYSDGAGTGFTSPVSFGPDPNNKFITTWFRRKFEIGAEVLANVESLTAIILRDDGAVVYLNGQEVIRDNVPAGDLDASTPALSPSSTTTSWPLNASMLKAGTNIIAVEVRQQSERSSDLFFDMQIYGNKVTDSVTYTLTAENEDGFNTAEVTIEYEPAVDGSPLPAEPVFLMSTHPSGVDWTYASTWSNRMEPSADHSYVVRGNYAATIRSPSFAVDPEFPAPLLLDGPRSRLVLVHGNGSTARIQELTIRDGAVLHGANGALLQLGTADSIIIVEDSAEIRHAGSTGTRVLAIGSKLLGDGTITVSAPDVADSPTALLLLGDGSGFTGDWVVGDAVSAAGHLALGSGDILITETGTLDLDYHYHNPSGKLTMERPTSQLIVDHTISFAEVTIQGSPLPAGTYEGVALEALGRNIVASGGALIVGGESPDSDDDGLVDRWEQANFGSLDQTGTGDFDGDGATNAAEEVAGTDPANASSIFRLSVSVSSDQAQPGLLISWPGNAARNYLVQLSFDLQIWRTIALVPGQDGTTSFVDSANFPAISGGQLYYRVVANGS